MEHDEIVGVVIDRTGTVRWGGADSHTQSKGAHAFVDNGQKGNRFSFGMMVSKQALSELSV